MKQNKKKKQLLILMIYTMIMISGAIISYICDITTSGKMTWSLIVISSIIFTFLSSSPIILCLKKGFLMALIIFSILIIPFIYTLSIIINVDALFNIGLAMAIISLIYIWLIYLIFIKFKNRLNLAIGLLLMISIPFSLTINIVLSIMLNIAIIDIWDILNILSLLVISIFLILRDIFKKKEI